tara:strand:+ start:5391 stop:7427 length:2037 start_codon:yes stop_codon:yes gene_type:complete
MKKQSSVIILFLGLMVSTLAVSGQNAVEKNYQYALEILDSAKNTEDTLAFEKYIDELIVLSDDLRDSALFNIFDKSMFLLSTNYHVDKVYKLAQKQYIKSAAERDTLLMAHARKHLSASSFKLFQYDSCEVHLNKGIALFKHLNDIDNAGFLTLRLGGLYYTQGNYTEALNKAFEAAELFKSINQQRQLALVYMQLGNIYYLLKDYSEAGDYYDLSIDYYDLINDSLGKSYSISNLGLVKIKQDSFQLGIDLQREALPLLKKQGELYSVGNTYHYLAEAFLELNMLDSARYYLSKSDAINQQTKYMEGNAFSKYLLAQIVAKDNQLDSAIIYGENALKLLAPVHKYELEKSISLSLSKWYAQLYNYNKAYKYLERSQQLIDSLDFDINSIHSIVVDQKGKLERAEFELKLAQQKDLLQEEEKRNQQLLIVLLAIVSVILIFFIGILSTANKRNKLLNKRLTENQNNLEQELLNKRSLLKEIHHRVKNNLQIISSMLSIQAEYVKNPQLDLIIQECKSRIVSMSLIHENLYKREDSEQSLFSNYIKELIPQLIETYHIDENKISLEMDIDDFALSLDDSIPCGLIINELVSNSLKHAFPNNQAGKISIILKQKGEYIDLLVEDNGIGLNQKIDPETQDTFGFLLIYSLSSQLQAEVNLNDQKGFSFHLKWKSSHSTSIA